MPTKQFGVDYDPATLPLTGAETLSVVQGGVTVDTTIADILDGAGDMQNPMTTAGDIIIGGVSGAPTRLPVGSNGQTLTVLAGVPAWSAGGGAGAMSLVASSTVSGSAQTSVTISGLDLATDGRYQVEVSMMNATGSVATLALFINGDTTPGNYTSQISTANGGSITTGRSSTANIVGVAANSYVVGVFDMKREPGTGRPRSFGKFCRDEPASMQGQDFYHMRNNTANVTSITITSSVASSIAIGSTFKVYKIS